MAHPHVNTGINKILAIASLGFFINILLLLFLVELMQGCATVQSQSEPPVVEYAD